MENFQRRLKKIEKNFLNKDKIEKVDFRLHGEVYRVLLLKRNEKRNIVFSKKYKTETIYEVYEILKPYIYRSFELKNLAIKAIEDGYIKTHYEVIEMLFSAEEIVEIINFMLEANGLKAVFYEDLKCQQKD